MLPLTVREATAADAAAVAELLDQLGYPMSVEEARRRLDRDGDRVLLAESTGDVVGLLALAVQLPIARARPLARITAMVVRDSKRRHGVGRSLMERAEELARAAGCEGIELTSGIRPERDDAHRFYESLGYERSAYRFWLPLHP